MNTVLLLKVFKAEKEGGNQNNLELENKEIIINLLIKKLTENI